jgi:Nif-specific regulatory protein
VLLACGFPGNVRELENCVQRTATLAHGSSIARDDFACSRNECLSVMLWKGHAELAPARLRPAIPLPVMPAASNGNAANTAASSGPPEAEVPPLGGARASGLGEMPDRDRFIEAMEKAGWVQAKAARILGLTPRQVGYALKKHDIEVKRI